MIIYQKRILREDLRANPSVLYAFGDNDERRGQGGQAGEMRGEPNAIGVRTKKRPSREDAAYWSDADYAANCASLDEDLAPVVTRLGQGGPVVLPLDGLGTGMSDMPNRCPRTFAYLQRRLAELAAIK
ncbi:MAG: hypothetical protein U1E53_29590 [Dongiaceae bacterium]